jgi:glutathione-regulated potassium-efflux system ancillary protein KefG
MARVLVLFAHPALQKSRVHRVLAAAAERVEGITFHDLYECYPDLHLNVEREQKLLVEHDIVVFQHPFYWYSTPAILKEWQDLVLEWGFAYGDGGIALRGKKLLTALSTGGPEEAYRREGFNHFTVRELLAPLEQTMRLCGVEYLPPFVLHAVLRLSRQEIDAAAERYVALLEAMRDDGLDWTALRTRRYFNDGPLPLLAEKGATA